MRSISWKLLFGFLAVSLVGTLLFFGIARQYSNKEIQNFLVNQDENRALAILEDFYMDNGTWDGITYPGPNWENKEIKPAPILILDVNGVVVASSPGFPQGTKVETFIIEGAIPIKVNGVVVGYLSDPNEGRQDFFREHPVLDRIDELLIISASGAVLLGLVMALVLSRTFSKPLKQLSIAAQRAATGDLSHKVEVSSKDEIGTLAESFNQMMEDLEKLISSRRQMTADIAHELRTPISVILGYTEGVHEGVIKPDRETFDIVHEEALRLERLVKDLRLLSKADVGELPLELQLVEIERILEEVKETASAGMEEKNLAFEVIVSPNLPKLMIDPYRIVQVLRNLIENAIRYSPTEGKITVTAENIEAQRVRFSVLDSGPGVSDKDLDRIFNRFYRVEPSRKRDQEGSGLGLAIARSIVEQHGGKMWAERVEGNGLLINFDLPVYDGEEE